MLYLISGLGSDESIFHYLHLPGIETKYITWISPRIKESIPDYAARLVDQIDLNDEVILLGVSFGGIIAQEIAKIIPCSKVIIVSSVKSPQEYSWQLSFVRATKLHKLFSAKFLKWSNKLTADYYFGTASKEESVLLQQIISDTDEPFMIWAIDQLMYWENDHTTKNLLHLHGTHDKIFPVKYLRNVVKIEEGGHFMMANKSAELSKLIMAHLPAGT